MTAQPTPPTQPAQPAPTDTAGHAATDPRRIVVNADACWEALLALRQNIAEVSFEIPLDEQEQVLTRLARDGAALNRLALALRDYERTRPPFTHEDPIPDAASLRARLTIILSEHETVDPDLALSGENLDDFVRGLHQALATMSVPTVTALTKDTGYAFYHLGRLAKALSVAANGAGSYTFRRVQALERALDNR